MPSIWYPDNQKTVFRSWEQESPQTMPVAAGVVVRDQPCSPACFLRSKSIFVKASYMK